MNKKSLLAIALLVIIASLSCSSILSRNHDFEKTTYYDEIDSIVVSYLDWNLKTQGALSCEDVKDFNEGRNAKYVITNKVVIKKFIQALSLVEISLIMKKEKADIRMVLDFYISNNLKREICLNYSRAIFIDGNLYRSRLLYYLIEKEIPKTTAPYSSE